MWVNIFSQIMAENMKNGQNIPSRKTWFKLRKLKIQPGYTTDI
jgi:hypothetical protein